MFIYTLVCIKCNKSCKIQYELRITIITPCDSRNVSSHSTYMSVHGHIKLYAHLTTINDRAIHSYLYIDKFIIHSTYTIQVYTVCHHHVHTRVNIWNNNRFITYLLLNKTLCLTPGTISLIYLRAHQLNCTL